MATTPFGHPHHGENLFDIYNDAAATPTGAGFPAGSCNFVDLSPGTNGSRCGCRRFWARSSAASPVLDQAGWCMCSHHACYHDDGSRDVQRSDAVAPGPQKERPWTARDPLSPVVGLPPHIASANISNAVPGPALASGTNVQYVGEVASGNAANQHMTENGSSMPDTQSWGSVLQTQRQPRAVLPPIPSQCLMPSQDTSAASSFRANYTRPFGGTGLTTLGATGRLHAQQPKTGLGSGDLASDQERHGAARNQGVNVQKAVQVADTVTMHRPRARQMHSVVAESVAGQALKNLRETVSSHQERLDRLETVSFSAPSSHDDCHEKHDHFDLRVTDLESRMEDVEKLVNDNGSFTGRRADPSDDGTARSVISASSSSTSRPIPSQELYSQFQSLQAQVTHLQSFLPSSTHVWEVEVVFLPFPLRKVWQEIHLFKSDNASMPEEGDWTQLQMTHSAATPRSESPFFNHWKTPDHEGTWLLPRACGNNSVIDRRLRSRGLVNTISVHNPDARSVHNAITCAFKDIFKAMSITSNAHDTDPRISRFFGLQSAWVPLRKIHKDSRLRFLSPAEMLTPTTWDVPFLTSVMMRSSEPRLFITHPDAYLQDLQSYEDGWAWQKLKGINYVPPEIPDSQPIADPSALGGDCWDWNDQLDNAVNTASAAGLLDARARDPDTPSRRHPPAKPGRSSSPSFPSSLTMMGRKASRPSQIRTVSNPIIQATRSADPRRRVASQGQSRRSSPGIWGSSTAGIRQKRRSTRSPSIARFTPRLTKSPSPGPSRAYFAERQRSARATTPLAYATPYSNAPLQELHFERAGSAGPEPISPWGPDVEMGYTDEDDDDFEVVIYNDSGPDDGSSSDNDGVVADDEYLDRGEPSINEGQHDPATAALLQSQSHMEWRLNEETEAPWSGFEEDRRSSSHSDGEAEISNSENVDPRQFPPITSSLHHSIERRGSNASSQPSEYPSTQRAWPANDGHFSIHEDNDAATPMTNSDE